MCTVLILVPQGFVEEKVRIEESRNVKESNFYRRRVVKEAKRRVEMYPRKNTKES